MTEDGGESWKVWASSTPLVRRRSTNRGASAAPRTWWPRRRRDRGHPAQLSDGRRDQLHGSACAIDPEGRTAVRSGPRSPPRDRRRDTALGGPRRPPRDGRCRQPPQDRLQPRRDVRRMPFESASSMGLVVDPEDRDTLDCPVAAIRAPTDQGSGRWGRGAAITSAARAAGEVSRHRRRQVHHGRSIGTGGGPC